MFLSFYFEQLLHDTPVLFGVHETKARGVGSPKLETQASWWSKDELESRGFEPHRQQKFSLLEISNDDYLRILDLNG